ncbi:MAG: hypothetical protein M3P27_03530 [Acidobacteriota bacterium]|nr:hypothetical protein [Acidobacteriota bacterium]
MRKLFPIFITLTTLIAAAMGQVQVAAPSSGRGADLATADLATIIARMERAQADNRTHFRPYVVTCDYKLYGSDTSRATSEVVAELSFQPPDQKQYEIKQSSGSGSGEKVVRRVLDRETEMARQAGQFDLNRSNYDFGLLRTEQLAGVPVYVLDLRPRRSDRNLLQGEAYVDAATYRIRRIVGRPAKSPSWLIKDLQLTLTFSEAKGMWMQTGSEAVANVRFVGKHVFVSHDVSVQTAEVVAENFAPARSVATRRLRPRTAPALGAGVLR